MKRYELYKDSGVAWIGEIPAHWETVKPKYTMFLQKGTKPQELTDEDNGNPPYLTMDVLRDRANKTTMYPTSVNDLVKVDDGDILVLWDGANAGEILLAKEGYLSSTMARFGFDTDKLDSRYWFYFLKGLEPILKEFAGGTTIPHLDSSKIMEEPYPIPLMEEQQAIVRYLDCKVAKIDKLIAENEAQVKELEEYRTAVISEVVTKGLNPNVPMRDSGIQWIGEIPAHWDILPLKRCLASHLMYGANETAESDNPTFPRYIRITDIGENNTLRKDTYKTLSPSVAKDYMLQKGDLLFARSGATVGKTYLYNGEFEACFAGYLIKASFNSKMLPKYAYYFTQTDAYNSWKNQVFIQATIQNIGADKYSVLPICVPPIEEQRAIISSIEDRIKNYNIVIEKLSEQIEELKAYKIALISEAVTGHIDVRDWQEK